MKNWVGFFLSLTLILPASFAQAQKPAAAPAKDATLDIFRQQQALIDILVDSAQSEDLPKLLAVRSTIGTVIENVESNRSKGKKDVTFPTQGLIQGLVIQYEFSKVAFGWTNPPAITSIYTAETADTINQLKNLSEQMKVEYGLDEEFYTVILKNMFKQMQKLLKQAEEVSLSPDLKMKLRATWKPIGDTIAVGDQGDRYDAFVAARSATAQIRELYPMFDAISTSHAGFPIVMELKGLNEFAAEFANMK